MISIPFKTAASNSEKCVSGVFDAITCISDGSTYAFQGNMVSKLTPSGNYIAPGFPKKIGSVFEGLPSDLDAALYLEDNDKKTYFFKGCLYYRFSGVILDGGYPKAIPNHWSGLPCDVDAAIVWSKNGRIYFFKGNQYYRYNINTNRVDSGYPYPVGQHYWEGVKTPLNAAFQWNNSKTYFFCGEEFFRYDDEEDKVESGYPLVTTQEWLGCERSSPLSEPTRDMCNFV